MIVAGAFASLLMTVGGQKAWYGRYSTGDKSRTCTMNAKIAWMLQELPVVLFVIYNFLYGNPKCRSSIANVILAGFLFVHYVQRTFIFPMLLRGGKPTPIEVFLMAISFCVWNGHLQSTWLLQRYIYPSNWLHDPRFIIGMTLAILGMCINIHSDHMLRNLRKPGETGYKIPRGGMFEYVSGANFFGEILEWTGFAIAQWSLAGFAFAFFTFANIGPRGYHHHLTYIQKFDDYPKNRRAVIPFIW